MSDKVTIDGLKAENVSDANYSDDDHITLQLVNGTSITLNMTVNMTVIKQTGYYLGSHASDDLTVVSCFLLGTLIKTMRGANAVENIQVGDIVLTRDPKQRPKLKRK